MYRLLALTSDNKLGGATPLERLEQQLNYLANHGVQFDLLVDPPQGTLELALASGTYESAYVISATSFPLDQVGAASTPYSYLPLLEYYQVPFVGSDYIQQLLVNDKTLCAYRVGIAPPGALLTRASFSSHNINHIDQQLRDLTFPLIVKPNGLSGSLGINPNSVVKSLPETHRAVDTLFRRFPTLNEIRLETFIANAREITVGVLGNAQATCESVNELIPAGSTERVYGESDKLTPFDQRRFRFGGRVEESIREELIFHATTIFEALNLRDQARFDFMFTDRAYLIDLNGLPVLGNSFSWEWQQTYGLGIRQLLGLVLAALHFRLLNAGQPSMLPAQLIASLPAPIISQIRSPARPARIPESTPWQPHCRKSHLYSMIDRVAVETEILDFLYGLVRATKPTCALETGTYRGATALTVGRALEENGHGQLFTLEKDLKLARKAARSLLHLPVTVVNIDSLTFVPPRKVDFLFLDSHRPIRGEEFRHFLDFLTPDAVIVWHDSSPANHSVFEAIEALHREGQIDRILLPTPRGITVSMKKSWVKACSGRLSSGT